MLVVDDDAAIRETLYQLLEDEGYQAIQASDGLAALAALRATDTPTIVLLDVMMPRLDGIGVLRAVSQEVRLSHQRRFIVMTASSTAITAPLVELMRQFSVPALIKPFTIEHLLDTLSTAAHDLAD